MYYKSISDLASDAHNWAHHFKVRYDCIVGIPRSGMLVANILALKLNVPFTDVDGLLSGRVISGGKRFQGVALDGFLNQRRKILVVDDSLSSGESMKATVDRIAAMNLPHEVEFGCLYVTPSGKERCSLYYEVVPKPRRFEWNILDSKTISNYCFDIDGVLCRDPSRDENDDGECYREFLRTVPPLFIPKHEIGWLVTSRLEKYREETERWLAQHGVCYRELCMLDLSSKRERQQQGGAVVFKAQVYKETGAELFIESEPAQAQEIAAISKRFVYCVDDQRMHAPGKIHGTWKRSIRGKYKDARRKFGAFKRQLFN